MPTAKLMKKELFFLLHFNQNQIYLESQKQSFFP